MDEWCRLDFGIVRKKNIFCVSGIAKFSLFGSFNYRAHVTSLTCKANVHSTNTSHTWNDIVFTNPRGREDFNGDYLVKSLLAPSFELVTFRPRSSSISSFTFLTGFGHFYGSIRSGPISLKLAAFSDILIAMSRSRRWPSKHQLSHEAPLTWHIFWNVKWKLGCNRNAQNCKTEEMFVSLSDIFGDL